MSPAPPGKMTIEEFEALAAQFKRQCEQTHMYYRTWRLLAESQDASKIFSPEEVQDYRKQVDQARAQLRRLYRLIERVTGKDLAPLELYYV